MDRSDLLKYAVIGLAVFLFWRFGLPKITGSDGPKRQPLALERAAAPTPRLPEKTCDIKGNRFTAVTTTHGASLKHELAEGAKYSVDGRSGSAPMDLVTTPDLERRRPLRFELRAPGAENQIDYDIVDWNLVGAGDGKTCTFSYEDDKVALKKVISTTDRPFELEAELTVTNKEEAPATHRASVETTAWRYEKDLAGGFGRQSPFSTQVECLKNGKLVEKTPGDFAPKNFADPEFKDGWREEVGDIAFAGVTNFYFAQALVPLAGNGAPSCDLLIEDYFAPEYGSKKDDPLGGSVYRSRLAWPNQTLQKGQAATYKVLHFSGPKEREVLAEAAGGTHHLSELIHLGTFWFIARILVGFLIKVHGFVGSWGLSIIILTVTVRSLLFPLTWKQIKSGAKMRQMKPELDELNKRYADDPQQKQLATMELWKKHDVNPVAGCLPVLAQMPVWFALYTSLQTAAELYHTPFLWFGDLSAPDTFHVGHWDLPFILPLLLGTTTFVQQKIMPQQMDASQQKMMTYMMPAIFTAMMLFLPAGLGVYMFTNSVLGIIQQLAVERYYASQGGPKGGITIREIDVGTGKKASDSALSLGKGDARV